MSEGFRSGRVGPVLLVRWVEVPRVATLKGLEREIERATREHGQPVRVVLVLPERLGIPDADARQYASEGARKLMLERCERIDSVLEGDSVTQSMLRTVLRTMQMLIRTDSARTVTYASVDEAIAALPAALRAHVPALRELAHTLRG